MTSQWNEERTAEAIRRWKGGQSASEIAEFLETSRGAVMGRLYRLGIAKPHPYGEPPPVTLPKIST